MCTALPLNEIYPPTKFHNHSKYSLRDVHWTKFKYEKKKKKTQRAITQKLSKQELQFMCIALLLDEIYPPTNFITIASIVLEMSSGQNSSMTKQRAITQKLSEQEFWFMCTALSLDEIYLPTKFHNHS